MLQFVLFIFTVLSVYMVGSKDPVVRTRAGIIGMAIQPVWLYVSYQAEMWGVFLVGVVLFYSWYTVYMNNRGDANGY